MKRQRMRWIDGVEKEGSLMAEDRITITDT